MAKQKAKWFEWGDAADQVNASWMPTITTTFDSILDGDDDTVQKALDVLDDHSHGYAQTLIVAKTGGDFTSLKAALATITDAGPTKSYCIKVCPGIYVEDNPIVTKPFVEIMGWGDAFSAKLQAQNTDSDMFTMNADVAISNITIMGCTGANSVGVKMTVAGLSRIYAIYFIDCVTCVHVNHGSAYLYVDYIGVKNPALTTQTVVKLTAGWCFTDLVKVVLGATITNVYTLDGSGVFVISNPITMGIATRVFNVTSTATGYMVINGAVTLYGTIIYAMESGTSATMFVYDCTTLFTETSDLVIQSSAAKFYALASDIDRDKISIADGATYDIVGYDKVRRVYRAMVDVAVGKPGDGRSFAAGEGGSYKVSSKVLSYDGSIYADETESATIDFPNLLAGTMLYFGDTDPHKFYGMSFIMGETQLNVGTGSIVWEYYDGGVGGWVVFNIGSSINGTSISYKNDPFSVANNGEVISVRFDQDLRVGVVESNGSATGWTNNTINSINAYWVRVRIVSPITTSMIFNSIRLKGNYTSIRINGSQAMHGEARPLQFSTILPGAANGSAGNYTYSIGSGIMYDARNNNFPDGSIGETSFQFQIPSELDTSCGLTLILDWATPVAPSGSDQTAKFELQYAILRVSEIGTTPIYFNGTNPTTIISVDLVAQDGDFAHKLHRHEFLRLDLSEHSPGDVIYLELMRPANAGGDTLLGNVYHTGIWFKYRKWQIGECVI